MTVLHHDRIRADPPSRERIIRVVRQGADILGYVTLMGVLFLAYISTGG